MILKKRHPIVYENILHENLYLTNEFHSILSSYRKEQPHISVLYVHNLQENLLFNENVITSFEFIDSL